MSNSSGKGRAFRMWMLTLCTGLLCTSTFVWLAEIVRHGTPWWDTAILRYLQQPITQHAFSVILFIAKSGDINEIVVMAVIAVLILKRNRRLLDALFVTIAVVGVVILNLLVRSSVQRPLPLSGESLIPAFDSGFPSSQAADTFAIAFAFAVLSWPTQWRWKVVFGGTLVVLAIGLSRVHLGLQYPSDILGGWLLALAWMLVVNFKWIIGKLDAKPRQENTAA